MKGSLSARSAADLLSEVQRLQASGIVRLQRGQAVRQIFIDAGAVIRFAASTFPNESMTALFKEEGGVTDEGMRQAAAAKKPSELMGTTLVRLGRMTKSALASLTEEHIRRVVHGALLMQDGDYEFQEGELPFREQLDGGMSIALIILEWVREVPDISWIRKRLGSMDAPVQIARRPPESYDKVPLNPAEGYTMSRVDGVSTIREICIVSPMGEETALRALLGLALAGMLELPRGAADQAVATARNEGAAGTAAPAAPAAPERPAAASRKGAAPQASPQPPSVRPSVVPAGRVPGNGGPPRPAARVAPRKVASISERVRPATSPDLEAEVMDRFSRMRDQDLYQVLGVTPVVSTDDIRRSYYALARRLHPDKFTREDVKAKAEKVFGHITEAYSTLSHADSKKKYDEEQALRQGPKHQEKTDPHDIARSNFKAGRDCLEKGKLGEALSFLQNACEQDPSKAEYFHYLALTQSKNPRWKKDAETNFLKALEIDPSNGELYAQLGSLYAKGGLHSKARDMFHKALQWDPGNEEAQQGLAAEEGGGKGLLGMFHKKP